MKTQNKLALFGGSKLIEKEFKRYNPIGKEEIEAATAVVKSGILSNYLGVWHEDFYGGEKVKEFEALACEIFNVKNAISVNSWTSGLIAALGAIGIAPGDEVIVTPWTMCATATSILHWNAIPVFADIQVDSYNLCVDSIKENFSPYTKAIVVADIFGQSADMKEIMQFANDMQIKVISDSAQSPGAFYMGKRAGTLAHIGGYSLNYHKHIHTGEGGILVTDDDVLAERMRLIRNHAEAVVESKGETNLSNMLGFNFRLGEIEAAIGIHQLKKLDKLVTERQQIANEIIKGLEDINELKMPVIKENRTHAFYILAMQINTSDSFVKRDKITQALRAEGLEISNKYQNIHLLPMYQRKIAFGDKGFPWSSDICKREISYNKGICPNAEILNDELYLGFNVCSYELGNSDITKIIDVFHKVWGAKNLLIDE